MIYFFALLSLFPGFSMANTLSTTQAHSTAKLVTSHRHLVPGKNSVGLHITLEPKWHTYWVNPGDSAASPIMKFELPDYVSASNVIFPTPKRIPFGPLQSFGYENEVLLMFELHVGAPPPGTEDIKVVLNAEWLVCKEECIPGVFQFFKTMRVSTQTPEPSKDHSLFVEYSKKIPRVSQQNIQWDSSDDKITLILDGGIQIPEDIFPFSNQLVGNEPPLISSDQGVLSAKDFASNIKKERFLFIYPENKAVVHSAFPKTKSLMAILAMAFLGGLILNIMPCVLPILSLKTLMLVESRESGFSKFVRSNLLYTLGVITSFAVMALVLILLNLSGQQLGWGFQLQSPGFVLFLIAVFSLMGLMFLDIIPLNFARLVNWSSKTQNSSTHWKSSLMTGVLAVVVASPCTAPFMGAAMGYSLGQPPHVVVAIFVSLGLGLAFPFLAICVSPKALSLLPRPGAWMSWVKKLMAVPMFLTAAWLVWVLQLQVTGSPLDENSIWENYEASKLEIYKNDSRPVFLNATAAWCISCQVNDKVVFQTEEVRQYFQQKHFHLVKADWTSRNSEIAMLLRNHNRVGVPLYLYYPPGQSQPTILPEVLTVKSLLSTLEN